MSSVNKIFIQAGHNPVRFTLLAEGVPYGAPPVGYGVSNNPHYNTLPFDLASFAQSFKPWNNSSRYAQKYQFTDITELQFHTNTGGGGSVSLALIDSNLRVWDAFTIGSQTVFSGNTYEINGVDISLYTTRYVAKFNGFYNDLPEGCYYLICNVAFDTSGSAAFDEIDCYLSEPIYIAERHSETVLIEYSHRRNQNRTIFYSPSAFKLRVEGSVDTMNLQSLDTQYNDQRQNMRLLNSYPYRTWVFDIGAESGVPEWIWDKVHLCLACDTVGIDGIGYAKDEGAQWSVANIDKRITGNIVLRESNNYNDWATVRRKQTVIFAFTRDSGAIVPFAAHSVSRGLLFWPIGKAVYNDNDLLELVNILNTTIVIQTAGYYNSGSFTISGNSIVFSGTITDFVGMGLYKRFGYIKDLSIDNSADIDVEGEAVVIGWGDGDSEGVGNNSTVASYALTHDYIATIGLLQVDVFHQHNSTIQSLSIEDTANTALVPTDKFRQLQTLVLKNFTFTSLDLRDLLETTTSIGYQNIVEIQIEESPLSSISGLSGSGTQFGALTSMLLRNNNFDTTDVNGVLVDINNNFSSLLVDPGGTLDVTSNAPPSGAGVTAKNNIISTYSWTVNTD